jgi:excinuclease ABC subunit B
LERTGGVFTEQVIRPTGLVDPEVEVRPVTADDKDPASTNQVEDCIAEVNATAGQGYRTLVTVLTKKMAEDLTEFMHERGIKVRYMHSDVDTVERIEIIRDLRLGAFDCLVGINLLREGLDIPECGLVAILDADKEGFLRSETSLVQTIGRAARNKDGRVILYADKRTGSMERAMAETERRRAKQIAHNEKHGITPQSVEREVGDIIALYEGGKAYDVEGKETTIGLGNIKEERKVQAGANLRATIDDLRQKMRDAAANLEFEEAARLRDEVKKLEAQELTMADPQVGAQPEQVAEGQLGHDPSKPSRGGRSARKARGKDKQKGSPGLDPGPLDDDLLEQRAEELAREDPSYGGPTGKSGSYTGRSGKKNPKSRRKRTYDAQGMPKKGNK